MAGMCCGVVGESEATASVEPTSLVVSRRRRLDLIPLKFVADVAVPPPVDTSRKRQRLDLSSSLPRPLSSPRDCDNVKENCKSIIDRATETVKLEHEELVVQEQLKFGMTSVCGRRRDMEDAVSIHTSFSGQNTSFFGVFDGHGCSHVSTRNWFCLVTIVVFVG